MKRVAAALLLATLLAGCSSRPADSRVKPTFGGSSASVPNADELAKTKATAGIQDCPATKATKATVKELPLLAKAHKQLGARVQILGIDFADDAPDAALALATKAGVTYPLASDPKSTLKDDLLVVGLPQTVFVDEQGTIVATERRAYRSYDDLTAAISQHLGVKP